MTPRVSVIVPTRNRLRQLQRAVASVNNQTVTDRELIVIDDASTDDTPGWLATQPAIRCARASGGTGAGAARNRGLDIAAGEFIAFLDDDDVWHPRYLERQLAQLERTPQAALSFSDHVEVDGNGNAWRPDTEAIFAYSHPIIHLLAEAFVHTMSVVVCRRRLFETIGRFDESLAVVQDYEWYARILSQGEQFVHVRETLVQRTVPGGLVTQHRTWAREETQVVARMLAAAGASRADGRLVRAYRSVFFAHLALTRRDVAFGMMQLAAALQASPLWTARIAARRVARRFTHSSHATPTDLLLQ